MIKQEETKQRKIFFLYGIGGLLASLLLTYIVFFTFSMRYKNNGPYTIGFLISSLWDALPYMVTGIIFYSIGFAFRGMERKSFGINLKRLDDTEKWIYLGIIRKSMNAGPDFINGKEKGIPERFYPGG